MPPARVAPFAFTLAALLAGAAVAIVSACKSDTQATAKDKLCTPGAYVFCRCKDRSEGTKLCKDDAASFEACECGGSSSSSTGGPPDFDPDAGFEVVDSGPPQPPDTSIDGACVGKLAVVASSAADGFLWGAAYTGKGTWTVAKSGPTSNLRSQPRGALIGGSTLVVVWRTRYDLIGWTKFQANQMSLSPSVTVGLAYTNTTPDFTSTGAPGGTMVYLGAPAAGFTDTFGEGLYSPASGWDDANAAIDGGAALPGKSAPVVASLGDRIVLAFTATDGSLATQTRTGGKWAPAETIAGIKTYEETPAIAALNAGAEDLLIAYVGNDLLLHSVARSGSSWGAPLLIDTAASPDGPPNLVAMSKGRALLSWRAADGTPFYSVYDPAKSPRWTQVTGLFPQKNLLVTTAPTLAPGRCGGEVTATYVDSDGNVGLGFFITGLAGDWRGPYPVPGLTKMTFAGAGEVP